MNNNSYVTVMLILCTLWSFSFICYNRYRTDSEISSIAESITEDYQVYVDNEPVDFPSVQYEKEQYIKKNVRDYSNDITFDSDEKAVYIVSRQVSREKAAEEARESIAPFIKPFCITVVVLSILVLCFFAWCIMLGHRW